MRLRKKMRLLLWIGIPLLILIGAGYYLINKVFVPDNFTKTRAESSAIAKEIVSLIEASLGKLDEISFQDRQYNFQKALQLVKAELENAKESRSKAVELTKELDLMARSALGITPTKARNLAIEAISHELALISQLIVYNDALNSLLKTLEFKFSGDIRYDADDVQKLVKNMNDGAKEINKLNDLFNQKMRDFDNVVN